MAYITTVRLPDALAEQVKLYCARTGASVNGAVVVAVERLVAEMWERATIENPFLPEDVKGRLAGREAPAGPADGAESVTGTRLEPVSRPASSSENVTDFGDKFLPADEVLRPRSSEVTPDWRGGKP